MNRSAMGRAPGRLVLNPAPACVMPRADGRTCGNQQAPDCPFPLCRTHVADVYSFARERSDLVEFTADLHIDAIARHTAKNRHRDGSGDLMMGWGAVVYYLETGGVIKIGTSTSLRDRLKSYPPDSRVLAVEPGWMRVEARRLARFRQYKTGRREWHYPAPELLAYIERLAKIGLRPIEHPVEARLVEALPAELWPVESQRTA